MPILVSFPSGLRFPAILFPAATKTSKVTEGVYLRTPLFVYAGPPKSHTLIHSPSFISPIPSLRSLISLIHSAHSKPATRLCLSFIAFTLAIILVTATRSLSSMPCLFPRITPFTRSSPVISSVLSTHGFTPPRSFHSRLVLHLARSRSSCLPR